MELNTGMTKEDRAAMSAGLSKLLADTYILYIKTQNFHWNIHGTEFYALHILTEKQYEELAGASDEIAERIRALGFFVDGTAAGFLKLTSIEEDEKVHTKQVYLEKLLEAHEIVIRDLRALGELAEKHGDFGTADLVGRRLGEHEKAAWMLRSQL